MSLLDRFAALLDWLLRVAWHVSRAGALVGGILLLLTVAYVLVEITARNFLALRVRGANEISAYVLAICSAWSFAYALFLKAHIRIDVLYVRLGPRVRASLDILALLAFALFVSLMLWFVAGFAETAWQRGSLANTPLQTPLWIPRGLWLIGLAWFCLCVYLMLLRSLVAAILADGEAIRGLTGSRTLDTGTAGATGAGPAHNSVER